MGSALLAEVDGLLVRQLHDHDAFGARGADARLLHGDALAPDLADLQARRNGSAANTPWPSMVLGLHHHRKLLVRRARGCASSLTFS
jgi:hypothetical protein